MNPWMIAYKQQAAAYRALHHEIVELHKELEAALADLKEALQREEAWKTKAEYRQGKLERREDIADRRQLPEAPHVQRRIGLITRRGTVWKQGLSSWEVAAGLSYEAAQVAAGERGRLTTKQERQGNQ